MASIQDELFGFIKENFIAGRSDAEIVPDESLIDSGRVRIVGADVRNDDSQGNGVAAFIYHNSDTDPLWSRNIINGASASYNNIDVTVESGNRIYFMVSARGDPEYDTTYWNPTIRYI